MKINYQVHGAGKSILLIHGLFGSLSNLSMIARDLAQDHQVIQVDLRNHGRSFHAPTMSYHEMAEDIRQVLAELKVENVTIIGHSMGGKVAMALTALMPNHTDSLIVIDMAPVIYKTRRHDEVFKAVREVIAEGVTHRQDAAAVMRRTLKDEGVIQFILKSFHQGRWMFNVDALYNNYDEISGWIELPVWNGPTLFIKGENSNYITNAYRPDILRQFPNAKAHVISGTGHWVHGEKPEATLRVIRRFLSEASL